MMGWKERRREGNGKEERKKGYGRRWVSIWDPPGPRTAETIEPAQREQSKKGDLALCHRRSLVAALAPSERRKCARHGVRLTSTDSRQRRKSTCQRVDIVNATNIILLLPLIPF